MEIKPCKCGAFHGYMVEVYKHGSNWEIACVNCGRSTYLKASYSIAVKVWNKMMEKDD